MYSQIPVLKQENIKRSVTLHSKHKVTKASPVRLLVGVAGAESASTLLIQLYQCYALDLYP